MQRESKQQVPNMSRHLFASAALLLLVLTCRSTCEAAGAERIESRSVELFTPGKTVLPDAEKDKANHGSPQDGYIFHDHSLADVNGVMIAIARASYTTGGPQFGDAGTWAMYIAYGRSEQLAQVTAMDIKQWSAPVAVKQKGQGRQLISSFDTRAVAKDNKAYFVVTTNKMLENNEQSGVEYYLEAELIVGEVTESGGEKKVSFGTPQLLRTMFAAEMAANSWKMLAGNLGARGVVIGGNTIVLPLLATNDTASEESVCTVIYSEDNGNHWKFPTKGAIADDCRGAILLAWEGKLFMVGSYHSPQRGVHESSDMGKTWSNAVGPLSRLLMNSVVFPMVDFSGDLITATIENTPVLLYSWTFRNTEKGPNLIHLWLSDGTRTYDVGPISLDIPGIEYSSTLLYTNGELFALYTKMAVTGTADDDAESSVLVHLAGQLQRIKAVLATWKAVDSRLSTHCISAAEGPACVGRMPTIGLFGFLSDKGTATQWDDEYLGVGATVPAAAKRVRNGFELTGRGGAIVWPMRGENSTHYEEDEFYSYDELTVVATVTINEVPQGVTPLLGVTMTSGRCLALFYDNQNQWTNLGGEEPPRKIAWGTAIRYRVVLTLKNGKGSAYVDGQYVGKLEGGCQSTWEYGEGAAPAYARGITPSARRESVFEIFFGDYGAGQTNEQNSVTVTNAFRYNRFFSDAEVEALELEGAMARA